MEVKKISVIFPAFNEEKNIRSTIERAVLALRSRFDAFEVLIIDDGSRDSTWQIAKELAAAYPETVVLQNATNMGLGETLYRGFQCAAGDLVIQNSMDYPLDLRDLDKMLPLLDRFDVIVAVRTSYAGYTAYRRVMSRINRVLLRTFFSLQLRDYNYTQLFKRTVLEAVHPTSRSTVFMVPEILIRASEKGFRITQVDIEYHPRLAGVATSGKISTVLRSARDMFLFWVRHVLFRRPLEEARHA